MSLIPYHPRDGREIVLRHRDAVVVRDPTSHRLELRGSVCPTCHQPIGRSTSPERHFERSYDLNQEYLDPEYFQMLRTSNRGFFHDNGPPSPVRRLVEPALAVHAPQRSTESPPESVHGNIDMQSMSGSPGVPQDEDSKIRKEALSPNYFQTFFVEERILGKGGKGVVLLVRHEIDGCPLGHFACKRVPVGDNHSWLEKVLVEVELLAKLSHPNLVSYRHVWLENVKLNRFGPSVACAFILQQYCNGGDLHQYVIGGAPKEVTKEELKEQMRRRSRGHAETPPSGYMTRQQLSFEEIYSLFKDITSGVAYLHAANYVHRDLKPSNCLLHREGGKLSCLISDFGEVQPENVVRKSTGSTGTISYCAPEVLKMDHDGQYGNFTTKSDVFSLGMILYFMCFGRLPYQGANAIQEELEDIDQLRNEIADWEGFQDERQERPDLPSKLYKLLKKLLALDPSERPSATEVLLAMKSETNFDNITNSEWVAASSNTLRGSRILNLDSPGLPASPVPDTTEEKARRRQSVQSETKKAGSQFLNVQASYQSSQSSKVDISVDREKSDAHSFAHVQKDARNARPDISGMEKQNTDRDELRSSRLLLAPPQTRDGEMRHRLTAAIHRICPFFRAYIASPSSTLRLVLFLFKLLTLTQTCWPYMASLEVGVPLVIIASLEFGWPGLDGNIGHHDCHNTTGTGTRRQVNATLSIMLLALHFSVLYMARRWNVLCTRSTQDVWDSWRDDLDVSEL